MKTLLLVTMINCLGLVSANAATQIEGGLGKVTGYVKVRDASFFYNGKSDAEKYANAIVLRECRSHGATAYNILNKKFYSEKSRSGFLQAEVVADFECLDRSGQRINMEGIDLMEGNLSGD